MNQQQILAILRAFGIQEFDSAIQPALVATLIINPNLTDDQLRSEEDGTIKHAARKKIGWVVDIVWPVIEPYVEQAITAAIPEARATIASMTAAPPSLSVAEEALASANPL